MKRTGKRVRAILQHLADKDPTFDVCALAFPTGENSKHSIDTVSEKSRDSMSLNMRVIRIRIWSRIMRPKATYHVLHDALRAKWNAANTREQTLLPNCRSCLIL